jgi:hypothetical protein
MKKILFNKRKATVVQLTHNIFSVTLSLSLVTRKKVLRVCTTRRVCISRSVALKFDIA